MLRIRCLIATTTILTAACGSELPHSFTATDGDVVADAGLGDGDAAALTPDAGVTDDAGALPAVDAGGTDAGAAMALDAGSPTVCLDEEIVDGTRCISRTVDTGLMTATDVCLARGGDLVRWDTIEEQRRLQAVIFPALPGGAGMTRLHRNAAGTWLWPGGDFAYIDWASPPSMPLQNYASFGGAGCIALNRAIGSAICVRETAP